MKQKCKISFKIDFFVLLFTVNYLDFNYIDGSKVAFL